MKKIAITSVLALAAAAASAVEVGVNTGRDFGSDRNVAGFTVGERFGQFGVTAGFDRATHSNDNQNRYSVVGSYDLFTVNRLTVDARAGVAYVDNARSPNGFAAVAGVGARYPLTENISLTGNLTRQIGESGISQHNGNRFVVGVNYRF